MYLTTEQIERRAERAMDRLDRGLMTGIMTQAEYDREVSILDKWAQAQYDAQPDGFSSLNSEDQDNWIVEMADKAERRLNR